jgi:hypothetical protein
LLNSAFLDEKLVRQIAAAFVQVCQQHPSFFGLRDYYCLLQKLAEGKEAGKISQILHFIERNFG